MVSSIPMKYQELSKEIYMTNKIGPLHILLLWVCVDVGVMAIKEFSIIPQPYNLMQFNVILRTPLLVVVLVGV